MRAGSTACGPCTNGSTGRPRVVTSRTSGGAVTTSTRKAEYRGSRGATAKREMVRARRSWRPSEQALSRHLGADLRCELGDHDRVVRVHGGHGGNADARRLDDVDG